MGPAEDVGGADGVDEGVGSRVEVACQRAEGVVDIFLGWLVGGMWVCDDGVVVDAFGFFAVVVVCFFDWHFC